jgi:tetratricopeptide (TPR) repeat protein
MSEQDRDESLEKAVAFFQRAEQVADTDNFDYAIDLYMEGLRLSPDALEAGHAPLRKLSLIRQGKGGKKPSIMDRMTRKGGKTSLDEMLNAEYLLAKDPDNLSYAESMIKAAVAGEYRRTGAWIADLVFQATNASPKPSAATYLLLKESYKALELFDKAVAACQKAVDLRPGDGPLADELRDLSAQHTMQRGHYDKEGDFRKAILDKDKQDQLHSQEALVKTVDFRARAVEEARRTVAKISTEANVIRLADALADLETDKGYEEACQVLQEAYEQSRNFNFLRHQGELKMRRFRAIITIIQDALKQDPDNQTLRAKLSRATEKLLVVSLDHFRQCVENYPTDLKMRYEYGLRLLQTKKIDEAIPMFQEAQKDPRYRILAQDKAGVCFFQKGWYTDAIDIFNQGLEACEIKDNAVAKELRYNLARSHEAHGQIDTALELYRKLAQLDFGYRDVRERIEKLRNVSK